MENFAIFGIILLLNLLLFTRLSVGFDPKDKLLNGASSLDNCNCATFEFDWFDLRLLVNDTATLNGPFNSNRENILCCNSQQVRSLSDLPPAQKQTLLNIGEIHLHRVEDPFLLFGRVPILALSHVARFEINLDLNETTEDEPNRYLEGCLTKHLTIRESTVRGEVLDAVASQCAQLEALHLEGVRPRRIPLPSHEATMERQFNVFNAHFTSAQLRVVALIDCSIVSLVGFDLFFNATSLRVLSLSRNSLTMLENPRFFPEDAPDFWCLDLSYNKLKTLSLEWLFPPSLRVLKLDHNQFKVLEFDPFKGVWGGLDEFWVNGNNFDCTLLVQLPDWMDAIASRYASPVLDTWTCYTHNGTRRMSTRSLPGFLRDAWL